MYSCGLRVNRRSFYSQELLTRHKIICSEFLEQNYEKVFEHYQRLLNSENYVTRRQSLKLLGELLLDRHNFTVGVVLFYNNNSCKRLINFISAFQVMTRYISNPDNLKLMMNMLKEKSRNIQFEAFHVFKVTVRCDKAELSFEPIYIILTCPGVRRQSQ
jgi:calcium binding protein 39